MNWLGSPLESKNNSMEGSQVPRSMKYLEDIESADARRLLGAPSQESAKHHKYHDNEETEGKQRVL